MSAFLDGIGSIFTKITDHIQGRRERNRNSEEDIKREMEELLKKPQTPRNTKRYERLTSELQRIQQHLKNG